MSIDADIVEDYRQHKREGDVMGETKATPGPWEIVKFGNHVEVQQADPDGVCIAQFVPHEADARLIAAAPELLDEVITAALKAEFDLDGMTCDAGNWDGGSTDTCEHCQTRRYLARLNALIAKATGTATEARP
jgi:hypothetical protein